jgi:hypothetical protein
MKKVIVLCFVIIIIFTKHCFAEITYDQFKVMFWTYPEDTIQQAWAIYNKVDKKHSYSFDNGKNIVFYFTISKTNGGFKAVTAKIQNSANTKHLALKTDKSMSDSFITVSNKNEMNWKLAYGDKISITTDGTEDYSFVIGVDDSMSEVEWINYSDKKLKEAWLAAQERKKINSMPSGIPIHNYGTTMPFSNSSAPVLKRKPCSFCNGTGISPIASPVAAYGSTEQHYCPTCRTMVSAEHGVHLTCPSCQGKGYSESY